MSAGRVRGTKPMNISFFVAMTENLAVTTPVGLDVYVEQCQDQRIFQS
jgi:hypothetical protein